MRVFIVIAVVVQAAIASANPRPAGSKPSLGEAFEGPFQSPRLFSMPTAHVVGAYKLSLSGDASLVNEANVLSTFGVATIGVGDIAQLEYRSSSAISVLADGPIAIPALGVQLQAPFRRRRFVPLVSVALRFGFPQTAREDGVDHEQSATDLYVVTSTELSSRVSIHAGLRLASAEVDSTGPGAPASAHELLALPAAGISVMPNDTTTVVAEGALVPVFLPGNAAMATEIAPGAFARVGTRWALLPSVVLDASVGYRIEVAELDPLMEESGRGLAAWDIRIGGEVFIPWGALVCRGAGVFCQ